MNYQDYAKETQKLTEQFLKSILDSQKETQDFIQKTEKDVIGCVDKEIQGIRKGCEVMEKDLTNLMETHTKGAQDLMELARKSQMELMNLAFSNWKLSNELFMESFQSLNTMAEKGTRGSKAAAKN